MTIKTALSELGLILEKVAQGAASDLKMTPSLKQAVEGFTRVIDQSAEVNPWFIRPFVIHAIQAWAEVLKPGKIEHWLGKYDLSKNESPRTVGVVMAGNIPLVGLHDLLCVLASGHQLRTRLSRDDQLLLPALVDILAVLWPEAASRIGFTEGPIGGVDAMIATGSNNTSRYFEYYFGKYPHIIRKNRNGIAVLDGSETNAQMTGLARDIMMYFGLGCRSVSKVYIPEGYDPQRILEATPDFSFLSDHSKYRNNYDYQKSIMLINRMLHYDNGFLLAREEPAFASPVSVLNLERYADIRKVRDELNFRSGEIQCVVSGSPDIPGSVPFGQSQQPELHDYSDDIDTMRFLIDI